MNNEPPARMPQTSWWKGKQWILLEWPKDCICILLDTGMSDLLDSMRTKNIFDHARFLFGHTPYSANRYWVAAVAAHTFYIAIIHSASLLPGLIQICERTASERERDSHWMKDRLLPIKVSILLCSWFCLFIPAYPPFSLLMSIKSSCAISERSTASTSSRKDYLRCWQRLDLARGLQNGRGNSISWVWP